MIKSGTKESVITLNKPTKIVGITASEDYAEFLMQDESLVQLSTIHDQDCCEHVYGEFDTLNAQSHQFMYKEITHIVIEGVKDMGLTIQFMNGKVPVDKAFIGCHNSQNGYYSDSLSLQIKYAGQKLEIDVSDYVQDEIN